MTGSGTDTYRIGHFFADYGVESEVLAQFGDVYRFTIDPIPNDSVTETVQIDLLEETPDIELDLGLFHPKCSKFSPVTQISGDAEDHENQIPRARELAEELCDNWIIENVPQAPLDDPTVLNGRMYGLPVKYERAFETSFSVVTPPRETQLSNEVTPYYYADRSRTWWESVKGYRQHYPKEHLAKNCLPSVYVHTLARCWLEATSERDAAPAQDNNAPAPPKVAEDQALLTEVEGQ